MTPTLPGTTVIRALHTGRSTVTTIVAITIDVSITMIAATTINVRAIIVGITTITVRMTTVMITTTMDVAGTAPRR